MEEEPLKRMRFPFIATVSYIKPFKQKGYETKLKTPYIYILESEINAVRILEVIRKTTCFPPECHILSAKTEIRRELCN